MKPIKPASLLMLHWIVRLRWVAVLGQLLAMLVAAHGFALDLPWPPMIAAFMLTILSNHWLIGCSSRSGERCQSLVVFLIGLDSLVLTMLLYGVGGVMNPFLAFYLLLIALGAMTLSGRSLIGLMGLMVMEVLFLAKYHLPFRGDSFHVNQGLLSYDLFLMGWLVSLVLIGICISFFVYRIHQQLRERDLALMAAEKQESEVRYFQSLATMAAGVAHEMGTPLGTLAVASKELERSLQRAGAIADWQEDARLIRSEVERCRAILSRLDHRSTKGTGEVSVRCGVNQLIDELKKHLSEPIQKRLMVEDKTRERMFYLSLNAVMQALVVLIENAHEADAADRPIRLRIWIKEDAEIIFQVEDDGGGIPLEVRNRVGSPFFTTKKEQSGMGLGLFLVKTLTEHLGGSCQLMPGANGGTCATLSLPLTESL